MCGSGVTTRWSGKCARIWSIGPSRGSAMRKCRYAKTLARLGQVIGPEVIRNLHQRLMELARERGIVEGRRMRVDTTVVETNIHYPTDSSLLGDGARVLTRTMKKIEAKTGGLRQKIRDRMRTVKKRVMAIALATRQPGPQREERQRKQYAELLSVTRKILNQAQGVVEGVEHLAPRRRKRGGGDGNIGTHGRANAAGGEANQGPDLPGNHAFSRQDRERVRAAHGNHSQRQSQ